MQIQSPSSLSIIRPSAGFKTKSLSSSVLLTFLKLGEVKILSQCTRECKKALWPRFSFVWSFGSLTIKASSSADTSSRSLEDSKVRLLSTTRASWTRLKWSSNVRSLAPPTSALLTRTSVAWESMHTFWSLGALRGKGLPLRVNLSSYMP